MHSNHDLDRLSTSLVYCLYRGSPGVKFGMHRKKGYVFTPRLKMCSASDSQPLPRTTSAWEQPLPQTNLCLRLLPQTHNLCLRPPLPENSLCLRPTSSSGLCLTHNLCLRPPSALDQPLPQASVPHSDQTLPQTNLCLRTDSASDHQLLAVGRWFPPGTPVSSTRKLISSSFHCLDMTLAVAEALNPNKPKKQTTLCLGPTSASGPCPRLRPTLPQACVPDSDQPLPQACVPDSDQPLPQACVPDSDQPLPQACVPDSDQPLPQACVPDSDQPLPQACVPDSDQPLPQACVPDSDQPLPQACVPDSDQPLPQACVPDSDQPLPQACVSDSDQLCLRPVSQTQTNSALGLCPRLRPTSTSDQPLPRTQGHPLGDRLNWLTQVWLHTRIVQTTATIRAALRSLAGLPVHKDQRAALIQVNSPAPVLQVGSLLTPLQPGR